MGRTVIHCVAFGILLWIAVPAHAENVSSFWDCPWNATNKECLASRPDWRIGGYVGALSHEAVVDIVLIQPWNTALRNDYLADIHGTYTFYRFENLPLELELEAGIAKRFGQSHEWEFNLIPMARWTWLPWNNFVYTNIRLGLLGASYTTGVSDWEKLNTSNHTGSRYLNFLVTEITFAPSRKSSFETFIRVHHRSGIFGLINGVHGGSNYVATGLRFALP